MSLSSPQRRVLRQLEEGSHLRIVRSALTRSPVYCELICNQSMCQAEVIPMWRIYKLLATDRVRPDTGELTTANEIVMSMCQQAGRV